MSNIIIKSDSGRVAIPIPLDTLARTIWELPRRDKEALEELLEERFVRTVLKRAQQIPALRRGKKLISLETMRKEFAKR
jgi:hypothetical protein